MVALSSLRRVTKNKHVSATRCGMLIFSYRNTFLTPQVTRILKNQKKMETEEKSLLPVNVGEAFVVKTDAGDLCRLCANQDNQLIPIYRGEGLEHNLSHKIEKHLPIIKVGCGK